MTLEDDQIHKLLIRRARQLGKPTAYRNDLYTHDRNAIAECPAKIFIWMVRPTGTELISYVSWWDWITMNYYHHDPKTNYHIFNNYRLVPVPALTAIRFYLYRTDPQTYRHVRNLGEKLVLATMNDVAGGANLQPMQQAVQKAQTEDEIEAWRFLINLFKPRPANRIGTRHENL